jgi:DNA-binding HxlR family transcriptional regulator
MVARRKAEPERRSYQQFCGVARALDVVGERWTLLVVRNLLLGPRRYSDLLAELPGITTNLLAKRLRDLEAAGLIGRRVERPSGAAVYELTERGEALDPVVMELGRWGFPLLDKPRRDDLVDIGLGMLSLRRRYAGGLDLTVQVTAGERAFTLLMSPHRMAVRDRPAQRPAVAIAGDVATIAAVLVRRADAAPRRAAGALTVTGDAQDWARVRDALGIVEGGGPSAT